ncbi:MAG TPA: hypothetical protein PK157_22940 [Bryobacteraceae bacterium]|nr:hypothetical protein [Bryobacteraceae bacterium]
MTSDLRPYLEYKDSGLPWLGRIPAHWSIERAKWLYQKMARPVREEDEVVTCFRDGTVTLRKRRRELGFTNSLKEIGYQGVREGDLVIHAMDAFAGAVGVSDSDGKCTPVYAICTPKIDIDNRYYAYVVREMARSAWILALARGIRERSTDFRFDTFGAQPVPLPPRDEQKAIADYLDAISAKVRRFIRNRRRLIEVLNEQKQAIINRAVTRGLNPNAPLKPSGIDWLGDIPEHWETRRLRHVVRSPIKNGVGESAQQYRDDWPRYIRITDIAGPTRLRTDTLASLPPEIAAHAVVEPGDLLFAAVGATFGKVYHHRHATSPSCFAGYLVRAAPDESISGDYMCYWAQSRFYWSQVRSQVIQATIQNFSASRYRDLWLPFPPLDEQHAIVSHLQAELASLDGMIVTAEKAIDLIREYRARLIADVVTGKVDVRGLAPDEPSLAGEQIDEGIDDEEMLGDDEPELVEEATDAGD